MLLQQYRDDIIIALAEKTLSRDYALMRHDEENLLRQKARLLNLGDSNLGFFFKAVKNFHGKARISSVTADDGTRIVDHTEVKDEIVGFFGKLWT